MRRWQPLHPALVLLTLMQLACSHSEPFAPPDTATDSPLEPNVHPLRLTYGGGTDPAWLSDTEILYSYASLEHGNHHHSPDICLGILPSSGGTRVRSICSASALEADTLDIFTQAAPEPGSDRLAFIRARLDPANQSGLTSVVAGPLDSIPDGVVLANARFPGPHGQVVAIGLLRWMSAGTLVFLGADDAVSSPCPTCDPLVVRRWRDAYLLAASGSGAPQVLPGADFATSATPGASGQVVLTFASDPRVVRHDVGSGAESVIATFDPTRIPRDADQANGRIVVVAGGKLLQVTDDAGDPAQGFDQGGELQIVDATTGLITPMPVPNLFFRRPRWSPDGKALVAEGYPYEIVTTVPPDGTPSYPDTVVSPVADLYRIDVP